MSNITRFPSFNTDQIINDELLQLRVDRETEVRNCVRTLIYTDFNVYIHGERGVGKTFLVKTIQNEIRQKDPTVFPFFVRLYSLMRMPEISNESEFSTLVALELASAIWQQIYLQPVTALANRSNVPDSHTKYAEEKYQYVMDLYQQLSATIYRRNFDSANSIGISSIIKGSVDEKTTFNTEYGKLISIEILNVIKELITFLRQTENKRKLVAICDEANQMSLEWQKQIISRHLDMFTDINLQFVFVAGYLMNFDEAKIPDCFEYILHLEGLPVGYLDELLEKHFPYCRIDLDNTARKYLIDKTSGNIRTIMSIVHSAILDSNFAENIVLKKSFITKEINKYYEVRDFRELE